MQKPRFVCAQLVAIDGTKFKAVNSRSNNLNEKTVALRLKQTEEKIAEYLKELDSNDAIDSEEDNNARADTLKEKISHLEEKKKQYEQIQEQMNDTGQREISLVDPDSRLMRVDSQRLEVGYNIQTSVDAKQHLIVQTKSIIAKTKSLQISLSFSIDTKKEKMFRVFLGRIGFLLWQLFACSLCRCISHLSQVA